MVNSIARWTFFASSKQGTLCVYVRGNLLHCQLCSRILIDRPKIKIEDKIYCFRCIKKVVYRIQEKNSDKAWKIFSAEKEKYRLQKEKSDREYSGWLGRNTEFVQSGFLSSFLFAVILSIGLSIIIYFFYEKIFWIGIIIGSYLWLKLSAFDIIKEKENSKLLIPNLNL